MRGRVSGKEAALYRAVGLQIDWVGEDRELSHGLKGKLKAIRYKAAPQANDNWRRGIGN